MIVNDSMSHYLSIRFNVYYFGLNYFNSNFMLISIILTSIKMFTTLKKLIYLHKTNSMSSLKLVCHYFYVIMSTILMK